MGASSPHGWQLFLRRCLTAVLAVGVLPMVVSDTPGEQPVQTTIPRDAQSIMQTVNLEVRPDGTVTSIASEALAETPGAMRTTLVKNQFSPAEVEKDLPLRLTTSYRTDQGQGTDLSELEGHTGHVEIELTLQNLTVRPSSVHYDAGGRSLQEQALVGSPLTVFASTSLPGVPPSSVVMEGKNQDGKQQTNGALAQLSDGTTSVQWAKLLSPPSTMDSVTLRLVLDAQQAMKVPEFQLSVHPGAVSDPRASFLGGSTESETELLQRTVALAGDVQMVLGGVGHSIADLREILSTSTKTFGADAVAALKESNQQVETSTQALVEQLKGLQESLDTQLATSQSAMLNTLQQGVTSMEGLLGDPSRIGASPPPTGGGCGVDAVAASSDGTVSGLISQVSTQLDQYANASEDCRDAVREAILASLGPEDPSKEGACSDPSATAPPPSDDMGVDATERRLPATCALWEARVSAQKSITQRFGQERDALLLALRPESIAEMLSTREQLTQALNVVNERFTALGDSATQLDISSLRQAVNGFSKNLGDLESWMDRQLEVASTQKQQTGSMIEQNSAVARDVCDLIRTTPDNADDLARVYGSLTNEPCVLADGSQVQIPADRQSTSMQEQLSKQRTAWGTIASEMATDAPDASGRSILTDLRASQKKVDERLAELERRGGANDEAEKSARASLKESLDELTAVNARLGENMDRLATSQEQIRDDLQKAFDEAIGAVNNDLTNAIDPTIRQIRSDGERAADIWGTSITRSAAELRHLSHGLASTGQEAVKERADSLRDTGQAASAFFEESLSAGGEALASHLGDSAQDIDGARVQLVLSLQDALTDLGDPTVEGGGLLGTMATSTAATATTDEQVTLATSATNSFANVRSEDIGNIAKRRAVFLTSLNTVHEMPLFQLESSPEAKHTTVYTFSIRPERK